MSTPEATGDTDQLDSVLRAMEPGLLFTINDTVSDSPNVMASQELRVTGSARDETRVEAETRIGDEYRVFRDRHGDLVFKAVSPDGHERAYDVVSIEIVGTDN